MNETKFEELQRRKAQTEALVTGAPVHGVTLVDRRELLVRLIAEVEATVERLKNQLQLVEQQIENQ